MRRLLAMGCCGLGLVMPGIAVAAGGPAPAMQGGVGVSAPGATHRYVAVGVGSRTVVERVRRDGAVERARLLPGRLGVAAVGFDGSSTGLAADGRTLVLQALSRRYAPRHTHLVVLDARRLRVRTRIALPGWFGVDAISPHGRWLYLIHYSARRGGLRYEVRAFDLPRGRLLSAPVVDPREPGEKMLGMAVNRTLDASGRWAYTLYQRPVGAPFVHALDTQGRRAFCVDLPTLANGDVSGMHLRLARDGGTLRVDTYAGPQALVDTRTFAVASPPTNPPPAASTRHSGAAHPGTAGGSNGWIALVALGALAAFAALAGLARVARRHRGGGAAPEPDLYSPASGRTSPDA